MNERRCIPVPVLKETTENAGDVKSFSCGNHLFRIISPKTKTGGLKNIKNRYRSASLTVEAAMAFPVFFFMIYLLWQLFLLLLFQLAVCHEMSAAAMEYAHLGYPERKAEEQDVDISWLYQPLLWNALPESDRTENLWVLCLPEEEGAVRVQVSYSFVFEAVFFAKVTLPVQQNFRFYPYLGQTDTDLSAEEESTKEDVVYMTEFGTVYHESRACSYLNVAVRSVAYAAIGQERNSFGRKYTLCERCDNREATESVYISAGGDRYHLVASCPALKRTVEEKSREEAEGIPACHKCGNRKGSEEE